MTVLQLTSRRLFAYDESIKPCELYGQQGLHGSLVKADLKICAFKIITYSQKTASSLY